MNNRVGTIFLPPAPGEKFIDTGVDHYAPPPGRIEVVASRSDMLRLWHAVNDFVKACGGNIRRADAGQLDHLDFVIKQFALGCASSVATEVRKTLK